MIVKILRITWRIALPFACAFVQMGMSSHYALDLYDFSDFCGISFLVILGAVVLSLISLFISNFISFNRKKSAKDFLPIKPLTISTIGVSFSVFIFGQEKVGFIWGIIITILWLFVSLLIIYKLVKSLNTDHSELTNQSEEFLVKILSKCKKEGNLEDIEKLKEIVEQNIKTYSSDIEFFETIFDISSIYNYLADYENTAEYFNKLKTLIRKNCYENLIQIAENMSKKQCYYQAIYIYTYILLSDKFLNNHIKDVPDVYYKRALVYKELKQTPCKLKAIEDLKLAITKTKEISETLSYIEVESFLKEKIDKYNFQIGEIYQDLKEYKQAIEYYTKISHKSSLKKSAQEFIKECTKLQEEKEQLRKEEIKEEIKRKREFKLKQAEAIYNRALKEYKEHKYEKAKQSIENAIRLSRKQVYVDLLKEIDYKILNGDDALNKTELNQNNTEAKVSSTKKIKMESCTKSDLLTIDGFDEEKADRYIKERDNGKIYYDIESFVAEYGLMPHQMVEIQDKLIFPQRPKNKIGRKIDW